MCQKCDGMGLNGFISKEFWKNYSRKRKKSCNEGTEFITVHVIYNPAYTSKFQLKTTLDGCMYMRGLCLFLTPFSINTTYVHTIVVIKVLAMRNALTKAYLVDIWNGQNLIETGA